MARAVVTSRLVVTFMFPLTVKFGITIGPHNKVDLPYAWSKFALSVAMFSVNPEERIVCSPPLPFINFISPPTHRQLLQRKQIYLLLQDLLLLLTGLLP